jgi:hypothetical protein
MNQVQTILKISLFPASILFVMILFIAEAGAQDGVAALHSLWRAFRVLHYIPSELAENIFTKILDVSTLFAVLFLPYSFLGLLTFLWAGVSSEAFRNNSHSRSGLLRATFSIECTRKPIVPFMAVLDAVGRLTVKRFLMVFFASVFIYAFVWLPVGLLALLIAAIPGVEQEWSVISCSLLVSTFFFSWGYTLFPREECERT